MRSLGSVAKGIWLMTWPHPEPLPKWAIRPERGWWAHWWTPVWHRGRGPYLSLCLGFFAIYRGY